jgi:hypothetical protein
MTREDAINVLIKDGTDTNKISDGYHTFGELYEHRCKLFIALCSVLNHSSWRSLHHSDGSKIEGWFIMGLFSEQGQQITYHLPIRMWGLCNFVPEISNAPSWDGHTSDDVLRRLEDVRYS